ncbi:MAG: hypothetical protein R6T90_06190 [Dissulfuribacterales bacterium]
MNPPFAPWAGFGVPVSCAQKTGKSIFGYRGTAEAVLKNPLGMTVVIDKAFRPG